MDPSKVRKAVTVGAGVMGHSIAEVFAQAGIETRLVDLDKDRLDRALNLIRANLETLAEFGRVDTDKIPTIMDRIHPTTDLKAACQDIDFAIEVVVEVEGVKKEIYRELEAYCPEGTVLASNTSSLDVFSFAELKRPELLVVAHWFAPPHIIPLVEVCPGPKTDPKTVDFTAGLMKRVGKRPVIMKKFVPSFIVNRIQRSISTAVWEILDNGWALPEEIDEAVKTTLGIRLPIVGVVQTLDFTGLDLIKDLLGENTPPVVLEKVKKGHLGAKTSKGMYDYGDRSEVEILKKRDRRYLKVMALLEAIEAFDPV